MFLRHDEPDVHGRPAGEHDGESGQPPDTRLGTHTGTWGGVVRCVLHGSAHPRTGTRRTGAGTIPLPVDLRSDLRRIRPILSL